MGGDCWVYPGISVADRTVAALLIKMGYQFLVDWLGHIYVWRGGYAGGSVNGADSYLDVYEIGTNS